MPGSTHPTVALVAFLSACFGLSLYFAYAAVQGDYGLFRRAEIEADIDRMQAELRATRDEVNRMENLTVRLSDGYLDLDLLDEQVRAILGMARPDELVIR